MSGYKHATITISQEEYRRLHEAATKKKVREYANLKAQNQKQLADYNQILQDMENRQRDLEQAFSSLEPGSNALNEETLQNIALHNAQCYEHLAGHLQAATSEMQDSMASLSEHISHLMQQERDRYRHDLNAVFHQIDIYSQDLQFKEQYAHECLTNASLLLDFIQEQYDHERFLPGRIRSFLNKLEFAHDNFAQGFSEASMQSSQQVFLDLLEAQFELEQYTLQWQADYEKTCCSVQAALQDVEQSSKVQALGLQGEFLPDEVEVDYWTNGKFSQLLRYCRQLLDFVTQDQDTMSAEDFACINTQILPAVQESLAKIVYEARLNALNSQLRMNIAESAMQALEQHGFVLGESGYTDRDMRSQFTASMENPDGSQVSIQVLPAQNQEELTNELVVVTHHPTLKTEHEARLRWNELYQALTQNNLTVSDPGISRPANPELQPAGQTREQSKMKYIRSGLQSDV